jgi:hypothetical protein
MLLASLKQQCFLLKDFEIKVNYLKKQYTDQVKLNQQQKTDFQQLKNEQSKVKNAYDNLAGSTEQIQTNQT